MSKVRVGLVDDHALLRLGLKTLIDDQDDMEVVGEGDSTSTALQMVERTQPQVVLMDIRLPGDSGLEATRQLTAKYPETKVVMLTSFADEQLVIDAIRAGAVGYILKEVGNEEVLRGIRAAASGGSVLDAATTTRLLARVRANEKSPAKFQHMLWGAVLTAETERLFKIARRKDRTAPRQRMAP